MSLTIIENKPVSGNLYEPGLNLLEQFALKAPAVPDWFQPELPPKPERPEHYSEVLSKDEYDVVEKNWDDENDEWYDDADMSKVTEKIETTIRSWTKQWHQFHADTRKWNEDKEISRLTQWPFFYARQVIADYRERYINH